MRRSAGGRRAEWPESALAERRASDPDGRGLPRFIERDLRKLLRCGMLPHGFARLCCDECAAERLTRDSASLPRAEMARRRIQISAV